MMEGSRDDIKNIKLKESQYLLGHCRRQVPTSAVPRHSNASWIHRVLSQHPPLEEVFDDPVHVLIRDREVVCWGQAVSGKDGGDQTKG